MAGTAYAVVRRRRRRANASENPERQRWLGRESPHVLLLSGENRSRRFVHESAWSSDCQASERFGMIAYTYSRFPPEPVA
jgi:hypothetical protein